MEDFWQLEDDEGFDCIYSANVLEHVEDDVRALQKGADLLRPGGYFVAVVPAHRWLFSRFDSRVGHHRRYDDGDKKRLASWIREREIPLALVEYRYFNPLGALGWFVRMRLFDQRHDMARNVKWMNRLAPVLARLDRLPIPFGQSLVLCYKRTE